MRRLLLLAATTCLVVALSVNVILALNQESGVKAQAADSEWYMAGANPQRTSWVSEEVGGRLYVDWYRPIEAYIDQKVQVITAYGKLYLATARGLYVLNADTGATEWHYDTQMPLGHSPTVVNGKVYFGGYDKKIHALDALTGNEIWTFDGAKAGFSVNPLVISGKVYAGNRDGYFYALDAETGELAWQYPQEEEEPLGPIKYSAAYNNGVLYFASTDMHAYALNAETGSLIWKSAKLPGESFQSFWPVIYRDKVILSGSYGYRLGDPGTYSLDCDYEGETVGCTDFVNHIEREDIFPPESNPSPGDTIGPTFTATSENGPWDWAEGTTVMDGSRITEYFEDDGQVRFDRRTNKSWRRTYIVLDQSNGTEYTFDSDGDGNPEYAPILYFGTKSGNAYPPIVMPNDVIYQNNHFEYRGCISGGQVMGWKLGTEYLGFAGGVSAVDEPQAISGGGNIIYRSLCCDRYGVNIADITKSRPQNTFYWDINTDATKLETLAPNYDMMWVIFPDWPRLTGSYKGNYNSVNGIYHNHGDQNPIIPYNGRIYIHRSNAIIALSPEGGGQQLPLLEMNSAQDNVQIPSTDELKQRLEEEVQAIVQAGHLRPGYHNAGQFSSRAFHKINYFENPGDTLYTLTRAYPHLSLSLQQQVKSYLQQEYNAYFANTMYSRIGWAEGASREYMDLPPEVEQDLINHPKRERPWHGVSWNYPPHNFYAMWKYAQLFPGQAVNVYEKAKGNLQVPCPADNARLADFPFEHNAYIAGYIGFLNLQELAGKDQEDVTLRNSVQQELDRLLSLRANEFEKDNPWCTLETMINAHNRAMNLSRNFLYLVPELGDYLHDHALSTVQEAINEYNYVGPYWFVSSFEGTYQEGVVQNHYDQVIFQAKALILKEPREEMVKYLDVPAFKRGDLLYIQNLVATLEAEPSGPTTPTPTPTVTTMPTNTPTFTSNTPTPTPTATPTDTPTPMATYTSTPTSTPTPVSPTATPSLLPVIVDHRHTDIAQIPDSYLPAASAKRVMFRHASVGQLIDAWGLNCLQGTRNGDPCDEYPDYKYDRRNWDWPLWDPTCYSAQEKFDQFAAVVAAEHNNYDVMGMKLCYLNTTWYPITVTMWEYYRNMMLQLEADYPDTTFIWTTMPIRTDWDGGPSGWCEILEDFNTDVRAFAQANGKILYDIADIEAHDASGNRCHGGCETMCDEYGGPGHPNLDGSIALAKAFWWMMARIAGWNPGGPSPSPTPTPVPTTTPTPSPTPTPTLAPTPTPTPTPPCDLPGDVNCDCAVDIVDIMLVASRWGCECGNECYDARYDLDEDCDIDIVNIMLVARHWGETCPTPTPTISNLTTNLVDYPNGQVPRYEKFEVTFEVNTVAENLQLPYDPSPPPGLEPGIGITINALFTPDNWQTVYTQPAFYYQEFEDEIKRNNEWFYPTGNYFWKVRFSPNQVGTWQYKLTAQDTSGIAETTPQSFTVSPSDNNGFIRVSDNDPRYFEHDDGTYFPSLGYNMNAQHIDWVNPVLSNEEHFQKMSQNGIQLVRLWLSQWGIYTSAWNPWNSPNPEHHAQYIPISGISFDEVYSPDSELSMMIGWPENWWLGSCMFIGGWKAKPAVKRNTDYRVRVRYKTFNITGPRVDGELYGFVAKTGGWLWHDTDESKRCYSPGTGTVVTPYQSNNTSDWEILEGTIHIDNGNTSDFLPYLYLALENVNSGAVYIDYVWIEEDLGGGQYGPNIVSKPWMDHHRYMEQRNSYAFDKLLNLAKQYGVYLRPVILEKNEPIFNLIDYDGNFNGWGNDHFYGNWRQMTKVRWLQQAWWRYLQARWGYSPNIHSWELLNEGDPSNGLHYTLTDEFGKYMHQFKPNDHLVSTSNWHSFPKDTFWANPKYPDVDFADYHRYVSESDDPNFYDTAQATYDVSMWYGAKQPGGAGKPVIRGEIGFTDSGSEPGTDQLLADTEGVWLHNFIWGGINHGGLIESYWYENPHIYSKNRDGTYNFDHRNQYGNYYSFIKDIPLNNGSYENAQAVVSNDNLRAWGQKDLVNGNAHLWIQNKNHTWKNVVDGISIPEVSGEVTITGFTPSKQYTVEWWDTYTGSVSKTEPVTTDGDGNVQLQISSLQDDLAVKILNPD